MPKAGQGEVWDCYLGPIRRREQDGRRPCLIVSVDQLGTGPGELAIIVPLTRTSRVPTEIKIDPPEGGLEATSYALPYQVRAISRERLKRHRGNVSHATLSAVIANVHLLTRPPDPDSSPPSETPAAP
jgi:mRNA interferase MazF